MIDNWSFFKPIRWPKLKKRIDKQLERSARFIAKAENQKLRSVVKAELEQLTSTNNSRNVPNNATLRKEYVRCGKLDCPSKSSRTVQKTFER